MFEENLPPSELKKLRSKQRKAKKKAELESAQAAQAAVKREQHQKSKQQSNQETDPEAPQLDELIPEKLERTEDPLEKAIEFLKPLQQLAKERIETHLLAFEVYFRKNKALLMIQSIRRAIAIDAQHPNVYSCINRLAKALPSFVQDLNPSVKAVVDKATKELIGTQKLQQQNEDFIAKNNNVSIMHLFEGAKIMYQLEHSKKDSAIKLITSFDINKVKLEVSCFFSIIFRRRITLFYLFVFRKLLKFINRCAMVHLVAVKSKQNFIKRYVKRNLNMRACLRMSLSKKQLLKIT